MTETEKAKLLSHFQDGGSVFITEDQYNAYFKGANAIGRMANDGNPNGSMFVLPRAEAIQLENDCKNDIQKLEDCLGKERGSMQGQPIIRVDIDNLQTKGLRVANGTEPGATERFTGRDKDGNIDLSSYKGLLPNGNHEAVINRIPNDNSVTYHRTGLGQKIETGQGVLNPNYSSVYEAFDDPNLFEKNRPGEYLYDQTDYGKRARGSLTDQKGTRNAYAQRTIGGADRQIDDDGGHLISARNGGASGPENLEAQNKNLNRGEYKKLENHWNEELQKGNKVYVSSESFRSNSSERPDAFFGSYIVETPDGNRTIEHYSFSNASSTEQDAWQRELEKYDIYAVEDITPSDAGNGKRNNIAQNGPSASVIGNHEEADFGDGTH